MNFAAPLEGNPSPPAHLSSFLVQITTLLQQFIQSLHVFKHHSPPADQPLGDLIVLTDIIVRDADGHAITRTETSVSTGASAGHLFRTSPSGKPCEPLANCPDRNHFPIQSPPSQFLLLKTHPPSLRSRCATLLHELLIRLYPAPQFAFTIDKSARDYNEHYPGIITGRDLRLFISGTIYRVAIHAHLVQIKGWSIFRCYAYNSRPHSLIERRQGFVLVDNRLIHVAFRRLSDAPKYEELPSEVVREWQAVPKDWRLSATALLPEGNPLPVMSVVDVAPPDVFGETDVQE